MGKLLTDCHKAAILYPEFEISGSSIPVNTHHLATTVIANQNRSNGYFWFYFYFYGQHTARSGVIR